MSTCAACGYENREGRKFCGQCGAALGMTCPACGTTNAPGERFCGECGASLVPGSAISSSPEAVPASGERKQLTVLFADVAGSMDLQEELDPEVWAGIMGRFVALLAEAVRKYGGTVDKFTGDGIMALFGASVAQELAYPRNRRFSTRLRYTDVPRTRESSPALLLPVTAAAVGEGHQREGGT
jgi:hypothetical protein